MKCSETIRRRIRHSKNGVNVVADVNAVVAGNVNEPGRTTSVVELSLDVPQGLPRQLGELVGGDARLVFEVADPNRKVSVPRPATG